MLIIGLGGTGGRVLRRLQDILDSERQNSARMLYLDTDYTEIQRMEDAGVPGAWIGYHESLQELSEAMSYQGLPVHDWLPADDPVPEVLLHLPCEMGAGMYPPAARLGYERFRRDPENALIRTLSEYLREMTQDRRAKDPTMPRILIVGGLGGGTATGTLLEIADTIRHFARTQTRAQLRILGLFLLPEAYRSVIHEPAQMQRMKANTRALIRTWNAINDTAVYGDERPYDWAGLMGMAPEYLPLAYDRTEVWTDAMAEAVKTIWMSDLTNTVLGQLTGGPAPEYDARCSIFSEISISKIACPTEELYLDLTERCICQISEGRPTEAAAWRGRPWEERVTGYAQALGELVYSEVMKGGSSAFFSELHDQSVGQARRDMQERVRFLTETIEPGAEQILSLAGDMEVYLDQYAKKMEHFAAFRAPEIVERILHPERFAGNTDPELAEFAPERIIRPGQQWLSPKEAYETLRQVRESVWKYCEWAGQRLERPEQLREMQREHLESLNYHFDPKMRQTSVRDFAETRRHPIRNLAAAQNRRYAGEYAGHAFAVRERMTEDAIRYMMSRIYRELISRMGELIAGYESGLRGLSEASRAMGRRSWERHHYYAQHHIGAVYVGISEAEEAEFFEPPVREMLEREVGSRLGEVIFALAQRGAGPAEAERILEEEARPLAEYLRKEVLIGRQEVIHKVVKQFCRQENVDPQAIPGDPALMHRAGQYLERLCNIAESMVTEPAPMSEIRQFAEIDGVEDYSICLNTGLASPASAAAAQTYGVTLPGIVGQNARSDEVLFLRIVDRLRPAQIRSLRI